MHICVFVILYRWANTPTPKFIIELYSPTAIRKWFSISQRVQKLQSVLLLLGGYEVHTGVTTFGIPPKNQNAYCLLSIKTPSILNQLPVIVRRSLNQRYIKRYWDNIMHANYLMANMDNDYKEDRRTRLLFGMSFWKLQTT